MQTIWHLTNAWSGTCRVGEHHLESVMDMLLSITPDRVAEMQANLANAWMRYGYDLVTVSVLFQWYCLRKSLPFHTYCTCTCLP